MVLIVSMKGRESLKNLSNHSKSTATVILSLIFVVLFWMASLLKASYSSVLVYVCLQGCMSFLLNYNTNYFLGLGLEPFNLFFAQFTILYQHHAALSSFSLV